MKNNADVMKAVASILFYGAMALLAIAAYIQFGVAVALIVIAFVMFLVALGTYAKYDDSWKEGEA